MKHPTRLGSQNGQMVRPAVVRYIRLETGNNVERELIMEGFQYLIPIFGIGMIITWIITEAAKNRKIYELFHKERLAAIEKGIELPPLPLELFKESSRIGKRPCYLLKGLIWLFVGLTLLVALYYDTRVRDYALYALIPMGVGGAYLLYYAVAGRKEEEQARGSQERGTPRGTFKS